MFIPKENNINLSWNIRIKIEYRVVFLMSIFLLFFYIYIEMDNSDVIEMLK